jgi:hypothetical protein
VSGLGVNLGSPVATVQARQCPGTDESRLFKRRHAPSQLRKKQRYRDDPEFRAHHLAITKAAFAKRMENPLCRRLHRVKNQIWRARQSIETLLGRIETKERKLLSLVKQQHDLERAWRAQR